MSIKELQDDELLDYLMNSEYDEDINPDDLKYLLKKWKFYYRILHGKNTSLKTQYLSYKDKYETSISNLESISKNLTREINMHKSVIDNIKKRKLSWKERISGKIKIKEKNEN